MSNTQSPPLFKGKIATMTIWLTSECNLKCKYCFVYKLNEKQPHGKMTLETADQLIRFSQQNLTPNGSMWFFGAEPLCNFEVMKYIVEKSVASGQKWTFGATTNATLLTEEKVQWMKKYKFSVLCSIDGPKESHDQNRIYRDGKGSWDDAWRGLNFVRQILNKSPQIRWTVTPSTVKGLAENIRTFVEKYQITSMPIDFVQETEWTEKDLANLRRELEIFRDDYKRWMEKGIPVFNMWVRDANSAVTNSDRPWASRCGLGNGSVGIDYDGTIYPCHRFIDSHEIKIGNIFTGFDAKQQEWLEKWRKAAPYCEIPQKCLTCNSKKACGGGCIAMNYDIFGTPHAIPETSCTIKQLITEVLGDLCKSLQNNATFQKVYNKRPQNQTPTRQMTKGTCHCQGKPVKQATEGVDKQANNQSTKTN
jgi:uncharacterized protein